MFRCVASYCQTMVAGSIGGTLSFLAFLLFGGFIIPRLKILHYISPPTSMQKSIVQLF
jgi:hypothetical protein